MHLLRAQLQFKTNVCSHFSTQLQRIANRITNTIANTSTNAFPDDRNVSMTLHPAQWWRIQPLHLHGCMSNLGVSCLKSSHLNHHIRLHLWATTLSPENIIICNKCLGVLVIEKLPSHTFLPIQISPSMDATLDLLGPVSFPTSLVKYIACGLLRINYPLPLWGIAFTNQGQGV